MNRFFETDFDKVYPMPTPERLAEAYFNRLWRKMHEENFSFLIVFYGKHRAGKSLSAVNFCYILDPTFEEHFEERVVYNSKGLIRAFRDVRKNNIHGAGIVVDEAGTGDLSSQRWYEDMAKLVSANLQAVGYLNPFVCFVTQNFSFINTVARKLSQGVFEVERHRNIYVSIKPFWIENNPWITGFYRKYPIFCENRDGIPSNVYKLSKIKMGLPPKRILERYIALSQAYKDKLLSDSEDEIDAVEKAKLQKTLLVTGMEALANEVYRNLDDYKGYAHNKSDGMPAINESIIRHRHALSYRDAKLVKALVEQMQMKKRKRGSMPDE